MNMKKNIAIVLLILGLSACQKPNTTKNESYSTPVKIEVKNQQVKADELLVSLESCYQDDSCKLDLDKQLNLWLVDKNYLSSDEQAETDEHDSIDVSKIVTLDSSKEGRLNLSNDYMSNKLVKGALNEWLTWKRPQLINTWQYYQFLKKDMQKAFEKYAISEALVLAIMAQESGGKVHSRSRAGAGGLFQLMPATAKRLGLSGKFGAYDLRFNPEQSAMAAAKYIDEQLKLYDGDEAKILAAYNSGENRFARLNRLYKNKPVWNKSFYYDLPRETRHYVPVVIAAMLIFQNPEKFNVKLKPLSAETVTVQFAQKSSLSELAICLGQEQRSEGWFRVLRNLNSGIKADTIIAENTELRIPKMLEKAFQKQCQDSAFLKMARSFHESDFNGNQGLFSYRVKQGDSLNKIARKFRCTSGKEIAKLNRLKAPRYLIRAGKHLKIPQC